MPPSEHVELAAFLSAHGESLVRQRRPVSATQLHRYWTASRARWDGWMRHTKRFSTAVNGSGSIPSGRQWTRQRIVIEQILASEVPTRVWAAVVAACDRHCGANEGEGVVRSVLVAHQEARCRALHCLLHSPGVPAEQVIELNRWRRQAERWTDMLVGFLARKFNVAEFAADAARAQEFAADFGDRPAWQPGQVAWRLLRTSLRGGFRRTRPPLSVMDAELNAKIAMTMLDCFPPQDVQDCGLCRTLWLYQLSNAANETHNLMEELCGLEFGHIR